MFFFASSHLYGGMDEKAIDIYWFKSVNIRFGPAT